MVSGWCLHGSPSNELKDARVAFSLAFIADGARTIADTAEFEPDEEDSCRWVRAGIQAPNQM